MAEKHKFEPEKYDVVTYESLIRNSDHDRLQKFEDWIYSLGEGDNQKGPVALDKLHKEFAKGYQVEHGIYQTFISFEKLSGEPVAAVTSYPNNDTLWQYLDEPIKQSTDIYTGFLIVRADRRGQGLAQKMLNHMDEHLAEHATKMGKPINVLSCTWEPNILHIYGKDPDRKLVGEVKVPEWKVAEFLFMKCHHPRGLSSVPQHPFPAWHGAPRPKGMEYL